MSSSDEEVIVKKRRHNQDSDDDWVPTKKKRASPRTQKRKTKQISGTKNSSSSKRRVNKAVEKMKVIQKKEVTVQEDIHSSITEHGNHNSIQAGLQHGIKRKSSSEDSIDQVVPIKKERLTPKNSKQEKESPQKRKTTVKKEKQSPKIIKKENATKQISSDHKYTKKLVDPKPLSSQQNVDGTYEPGPLWQESDLLGEMLHLNIHLARNIIRLFDNDNTIPFIARYRRELTGDMGPEELRKAKDCYDSISH